MAHTLIMPRQGNTVESCIITDWKVKEGDSVSPDTIVCEVETDKASFGVPAGAAGTVLKLLYNAGDDVPVLKPIAVIGAAGEDWQKLLGAEPEENSHSATAAQGGTPPGAGASAASADSVPGVAGVPGADAAPPPAASSPSPPLDSAAPGEGGSANASPRARNLAQKGALPLEAVSGSGPGGRIMERDVEAALEKRPPLTAAARAAGSMAVPASGSGFAGRVSLEDVAAYQAVPQPGNPAEGGVTETPIRGIRKIISDRMHKSLSESAQLTLNASASAVKLREIRSRIKSEPDYAEALGISRITINDLVLFAAARTLPDYPYMNAHKIGDTIRTFERVHLAAAVDTPRGLMVPVIRNASLLSLAQISAEVKRLAAACQNGTALPDELTGSTFTVSNLGSLGISSFTPVLNTPEVAILGVCNIEMKAVEIEEAEAGGASRAGTGTTEAACDCGCECCRGLRFEPQIGFSLTINHQAVDGAPAARFLKALCDAVANIDLLITAS